jgi:hypothetical protein
VKQVPRSAANTTDTAPLPSRPINVVTSPVQVRRLTVETMDRIVGDAKTPTTADPTPHDVSSWYASLPKDTEDPSEKDASAPEGPICPLLNSTCLGDKCQLYYLPYETCSLKAGVLVNMELSGRMGAFISLLKDAIGTS